jgi:hypothetical protein
MAEPPLEAGASIEPANRATWPKVARAQGPAHRPYDARGGAMAGDSRTPSHPYQLFMLSLCVFALAALGLERLVDPGGAAWRGRAPGAIEKMASDGR